MNLTYYWNDGVEKKCDLYPPLTKMWRQLPSINYYTHLTQKQKSAGCRATFSISFEDICILTEKHMVGSLQ
jgi:hypothetical protein